MSNTQVKPPKSIIYTLQGSVGKVFFPLTGVLHYPHLTCEQMIQTTTSYLIIKNASFVSSLGGRSITRNGLDGGS